MEAQRRIARHLLELDQVPLLGGPPPFPWDDLASLFAEAFRVEGMTHSTTAPQWREEGLEGLGEGASVVRLSLAPLSGVAGWAMSSSDLKRAMQILLHGDPYGAALYDSSLRESFFHFLVAETGRLLHQIDFPLVPHLEAGELPRQPYLTVEVATSVGSGRLLLSKELLQEWQALFSGRKELRGDFPIEVSAVAGQTRLSPEQFAKLKAGDIMTLDRCTIDPGESEGEVLLQAEEIPLMRGTLDGREVTIEEVM